MKKFKFGAATAACCLGVATLASAQDKPWAEGQMPAASNTRAFPALTLIYRFTGVRDSGLATSGQATSLLCTNWGPGADATIRTVVRTDFGSIVGVADRPISYLKSTTGSTKNTVMYFDDYLLVPSATLIQQGSLQVFSTSPHVQCTAQLLDAEHATATFVVELPSQRFSPPAGATQ